MLTEAKRSQEKPQTNSVGIGLQGQSQTPHNHLCFAGKVGAKSTLESSESYLWLHRQYVKTYDLYRICHFCCSRLSILLFIQLLTKLLQNMLNFKCKIIVRHMSCTTEIRQLLPPSKIFDQIYTTVNEITSYF